MNSTYHHNDHLNYNRVWLARNIEYSEDLVNQILKDKFLTWDLMDSIDKGNLTNFAKVNCLINYVNRTGEKGVERFATILAKAGQRHAAVKVGLFQKDMDRIRAEGDPWRSSYATHVPMDFIAKDKGVREIITKSEVIDIQPVTDHLVSHITKLPGVEILDMPCAIMEMKTRAERVKYFIENVLPHVDCIDSLYAALWRRLNMRADVKKMWQIEHRLAVEYVASLPEKDAYTPPERGHLKSGRGKVRIFDEAGQMVSEVPFEKKMRVEVEYD